MKKDRHHPDVDRRNFLRNSTVTGAGAIVAAAVPDTALAMNFGEEGPAKQDENYRLTKHIADYYKSAM
ncbi:MAG: hypothetical protein MAG794_00606 [Gammaproteobacteria bacterium]|nr:hypothetical protein [Gammaproteobacteria bacterium]